MIENLTLEGTGVRIPGHVGALKALDGAGLLKSVKRIAGVSAGSIVALLYALGYKVAEIETMIFETDFSQFSDGNELIDDLTVLKNCGLHPGKVFLSYLMGKVAGKYGNPLMTFADLRTSGGLDLVIFAYKPYRNQIKRFSADLTPNVPIVYACRASMSIPGYFWAWYFPDGNPDKDTYVDAGTVMNYPIHAFDAICSPEKTVGIMFENKSGPVPDDPGPGHPFKLIAALAEGILGSQDIDEQENPIDKKRSIIVDSLGISATNFGITSDQKRAICTAGDSAGQEWIKTLK